jgi:lipoprotein-anchoring transpeptidase ErfK/SrfK
MRKDLTSFAAVLATLLFLPLGAGPGLGTAWAVEAVDGEAKATLRLEASVSEKKLRVRENGKVVKTYPIAVGKSKHPTPKGEFRVQYLILNPRWVPPKVEWAKDKTAKAPGDPDNPMGKAKIFFKQPDYYIHGTNDRKSLGSAASHGCIRMANEDVVELAKLVMKHGGKPKDAGWFRRVLNRVTRSEEVWLPTPVVLVVKS